MNSMISPSAFLAAPSRLFAFTGEPLPPPHKIRICPMSCKSLLLRLLLNTAFKILIMPHVYTTTMVVDIRAPRTQLQHVQDDGKFSLRSLGGHRLLLESTRWLCTHLSVAHSALVLIQVTGIRRKRRLRRLQQD